jgi:hypothetical protein
MWVGLGAASGAGDEDDMPVGADEARWPSTRLYGSVIARSGSVTCGPGAHDEWVDADARRKTFLANRERVRAWVRNWDCREIAWLPVLAVPYPGPVAPVAEDQWIATYLPVTTEYSWMLESRPLVEGVNKVTALWWFGRQQRFDRLEVTMHTYADPPYVAEKLALAAHAAGLQGWRGDEDLRTLYSWLLAGIDRRPMSNMVHGQQRIGFTRFDILRTPGVGIISRFRLDRTDTTLAGEPLNEDGEPAAG